MNNNASFCNRCSAPVKFDGKKFRYDPAGATPPAASPQPVDGDHPLASTPEDGSCTFCGSIPTTSVDLCRDCRENARVPMPAGHEEFLQRMQKERKYNPDSGEVEEISKGEAPMNEPREIAKYHEIHEATCTHALDGGQPAQPTAQPPKDFKRELESLINKHSRENCSNTPDFLLADYMTACLVAFENATVAREKWYGRVPQAPSS